MDAFVSLIIIGSGLAGYMLAKEWRKLDTQTPLTILTSDDGAFYSKPLLSTALTQQKTPDQLVVSSAQTMAEELNADIICRSEVTAVDPVHHTVTDSHRQYSFSKLVFACGAQPIRAPLEGEAQAVLSVNRLEDYRVFRDWLRDKKHIAILGAGLVACEFANDLLNAGYSVTLIAPDAHPLGSVLPVAVGRVLQDRLAERGAQWRLGDRVTVLHKRGRQFVMTLESGLEITADGVLSAVGLRPRIDLARNAGIRVNRGIVVDRRLRTPFSNIFALGDCAEVDGLVQMYVAPLLQSARALAKILAGGDEPVHYPVMPIVVKTPVLPLVFCAPPLGVIGEWHLEGEGHHLRALFHDPAGQLRGFILAGDKIRDKISLAKQLPLVFAE
jgi:rubredoxin---NAD+ reductase